MVRIYPFKMLRPDTANVEKFSSPPYDIVTREEVREILKENKNSFLSVTRSDALFDENVSEYDDKVYQTSKNSFDNLIKDGFLTQEEKKCLYIYSQKDSTHEQIGLVCCVAVDDYIDNKVKKHEKTREAKENDRTKHIQTLNAQIEPVFLTYKNSVKINELIRELINKSEKIFDFISDDQVHQKVWKVDDVENLEKIKLFFEEINYLYIADGHHRAASASRVAKLKKEDSQNDDEHNYFLSVLFPDNQLKILPYHRVIYSLNDLRREDFFEKLENHFIIEELSDLQNKVPKNNYIINIYYESKWYKLTLKSEFIPEKNDPVSSLDVSVLQSLILEPILNIKDPRTDKRIDFVGGINAIEKMEKMVDGKHAALAFSLHPTSIESLIKVSDDDLLMPPKSTWFEPKLRSGLFMHLL